MTAPSFVNSTSLLSSSTTPTITKPTSTADGDLLILFVASSNTGTTMTPPDSSWVKLRYSWDASFHDGGGATGYPLIEVWGKISASDGASWGWTASGTNQTVYICYAVRPSTGAWSSARAAVLCMANAIGASTTTPNVADMSAFVPLASGTDYLQISQMNVLRGDSTFAAPSGFTKSGEAKGTGDLSTRVSSACAYKAQSGVSPSTGTWTLTNVRAESSFSIAIVDPSSTPAFHFREVIGPRASGVGNTWGSVSSATIRRGTGAVGDLEFVVLTYKNTTGYVSDPSGYTKWTENVGSGTSANLRVSLFYRTIDGTEGDTISLSFPANCVDGEAYIYTIPGTAYPLSVTSQVDNTTGDNVIGMTSPSVPVTNSPGALWLAGGIMHRNDGTGATASTGYTLNMGGNARLTSIGSSNTRAAAEGKFDVGANSGATSMPQSATAYANVSWAAAFGTAPVIQNRFSVVEVW